MNPPDKATISLAVKPFFEKALIRPLRSNVGSGMLPVTAAELAVVESLLPKSTVQDQLGALSWIKINDMIKMISKEQGFNNNQTLVYSHNLFLTYLVYLIYIPYFKTLLFLCNIILSLVYFLNQINSRK